MATKVPIKYNKHNAQESRICVIGSDDGVNIALKIVDMTNTGLHKFNNSMGLIKFNKLKIIWIIGN